MRSSKSVPAGVSSKSLAKGVVKNNSVSSSRKHDLSLLRGSEGPKPETGRHLPGGGSRVDPGSFKGAAGSSSERFTYSMVNPEDWEFLPQERTPQGATETTGKGGKDKATKKTDDSRNPCLIAIRPQSKGQGECAIADKTDPITHFKHEGMVFSDPWRPNKRTGYDASAARQTWTWQQGMDTDKLALARQSAKQGKTKNKMDCRGKMHYLSGGEEDMIPSSKHTYIKCDMKPTDGHIYHNDKTNLAWVHRIEPSPRIKNEKDPNYHSGQLWDCMVYQPKEKPVAANTSTQCSFRGSDSAVATPPRASRGILTSVQSEPQIGGYRLSSDSAASMTIASTTTQNEQGRQSEPASARGSRESRGSMAMSARKAPSGAATPRGCSVPSRRTSRSASLTPRRGSLPKYGFPYNPQRRSQANTASRTSLTETQVESTPRVQRRSGSVSSSASKPIWR